MEDTNQGQQQQLQQHQQLPSMSISMPSDGGPGFQYILPSIQLPNLNQQVHLPMGAALQPMFLVPVGYANQQQQQQQQQQMPRFAYRPILPHQPQPQQQQIQQPAMPAQAPCYCGVQKLPNPLHPSVQCRKCLKSFHHECIESFKSWIQPPFLGDDFFVFHCKGCSTQNPPTEKIQRQGLQLSDIAHLAVFQFTHQSAVKGPLVWSRDYPSNPPAPRIGPHDDRMYFSRKQVAAFVDANWDRFWLKNRAATWTHSLMSAIVSSGGGNNGSNLPLEELRFLTGKEQFPGDGATHIALFNKEVQPSEIESKRSRQAAFDILDDGTLVDLPGAPPRPPQPALAPRHFSDAPPLSAFGNSNAGATKKTAGKRNLDVTANSVHGESDNESVNSNKKENETKKKKLVKPKPQPRILEPEEVDAENSVLLYPDLNNPEFGPVILSNELTHSAPQMRISNDGLSVHTDKGYRMSKATHGVYEGCWYYEVTFNSKETGHARVGWSQISGDLQAPCGYDQFSYSFRDSPGTLFHESKPIQIPGNEKFLEGFSCVNFFLSSSQFLTCQIEDGDVLGLMITLPPPSDVDNMVRRLWSIDASYVQFKTKPMVKMPGSEIKYFKNGAELGVAFTDLYNGKYYPAVSSYQHGTLTLNFGPNFKHPLPGQARPYSDVPKVFAWSDYAVYSYEPFHVYEKEFSAVSIYQQQQQRLLELSPPPAFVEFGKRKKKKKLVSKRLISNSGGGGSGAIQKSVSGGSNSGGGVSNSVNTSTPDAMEVDGDEKVEVDDEEEDEDGEEEEVGAEDVPL
ncbi:UNVERIFIED_CONTAM: Set1/Ash2 histone methyltransferase complex subunit ASH2 [Siphonaria sp. JEL0065]|nr:Set1/Ash2 histone methyltransferase complex subunit ASH2 [Siphonaria sp. JEL0065]